MDSENRSCQNCKIQFTIEPEDFQFYEKIQVPPPTFCPECRMIRRFNFWNENLLFRAKTVSVGQKEIFSTYPNSSGLKLYPHDYWWSDKWDPMEYGREYSFSRPFFDQFKELLYAVPWASRAVWHLENSDYSNNASRLKNCYLCFDADQSENCYYGVAFRQSRNCFDFGFSNNLELCYEFQSGTHNYKTFFSLESDNCRDVWFSYQCQDCSNCFGCINLRHKRFHIFNTPYSEEEYKKKIESFNLGSYASLRKIKNQVYAFWSKFPHRYTHGLHNENVIGEYVYHAKNVKYSYQCAGDIKNLKFCQRIVNGTSDSYDYTHWGDNSELIYESLICGENCRNLKFCFDCWPACEDLDYSSSCHNSKNLFGCVGLRNKSYCIFNKQYSKEEYLKLKDRIIKHMNEMPYINPSGKIYRYGEFFPAELSPLAYNETIAQNYHPSTREAAERSGYKWREPELRRFKTTLDAENLPDHIKEIDQKILKEIIKCLECQNAYRILPAELDFYKHSNLPLPRLCHNCRYQARIKFQNPNRFYLKQCDCQSARGKEINYPNLAPHSHGTRPCQNKFETTYGPDRPEVVYCEMCYQKEVV